MFGLLSLSGGDGGSNSDPSRPEPSPVSHSRPAGPPPRRSRSSTMKTTDRDLVDRARTGDAEAFGQLVRRHQQRIHRLAVHMLRDRAEAEDVTQETFIRAYQALARFDGRSEPYTWFYRITINLSLNRIRSRKSAKTTHDTDDPRLDGVLVDKRPDCSDPATSAQRQQLYSALARASISSAIPSGRRSSSFASTVVRTKTSRRSSAHPREQSRGASTKHGAS